MNQKIKKKTVGILNESFRVIVRVRCSVRVFNWVIVAYYSMCKCGCRRYKPTMRFSENKLCYNIYIRGAFNRFPDWYVQSALFKSGQWHFHQDKTSVHNTILVTDYLTKMGIHRVSQPPYSRYLAPCDFWLFPKLRGCRYETTEEMKEAMTKVIETLTQKYFYGAF